MTLVVNSIPDVPKWSAPAFPLMAAEDEAMLVPDVSVKDSDKEDYLRVTVSAENGRMGLPGARDLLLDVQEGIGEDMEGDGSFAMVGEEAAINIALKELVYYPPPDWTSHQKV